YLSTIGRTIRSIRREQGLSQEALADLAHIDRSYMSSIERGLRNISILHVARIATALHVPVCDLLQTQTSRSGFSEGDASADAMGARGLADWEPGHYLSLG